MDSREAAIEWAAAVVEAAIRRIDQFVNESKHGRFRTVLDTMANRRGDLSRIALNYYMNRGTPVVNHSIALLRVGDAGGHQDLFDISTVKPNWERTRSPVGIDRKRLPNPKLNYLENIISDKYSHNPEEAPYRDNFCYRLVGAHNMQLSFEYCSYFDFINTCEYQFYRLADSITRNLSRGSHSRRVRVPERLDPFDLTNRYAVAGINTLLIFYDKSEPLFYLHQRSKQNVAEAVNTKHVVPAGTFQPIHMDDANHESDFSLYVNVMREFGEELQGDPEMMIPHGELENILERPSIAPIDHLIRKIGRGKMYYGGVALDCLNLKPEILTIMVLYRKDFENFVGPINFRHNFEGTPFAVPFTKANLKQYSLDPEMLPAGAGCLHLAYINFDFIVQTMRNWNHSSDE